MKKGFRGIILLICAVICAFAFTACSDVPPAGVMLLGQPKAAERVNYSELQKEGYKQFKQNVEKFAAEFAASAYSAYDNQQNFTVSPISVYMALALASECADGDTRQEILDALGVTRAQLKNNFAALYNSLVTEDTVDGKVINRLQLSNSIWVNDGTPVKQPCIDALSNDFYAYSYSADFANKNAAANQAVREFVNEQTHGLIDQDFNMSQDTLFALINTLYLKTIWDTYGDGLPFADGFTFTASDGSKKDVQLLQGNYAHGREVKFDDFSTFFASTAGGYKIKFILPKDGHTVEEVFTSENIFAVNSITDYGAYDEANNVAYKTRVLFPEYKCKYDADVKTLLQDEFGINKLFTRPSSGNGCDFSTLSDEPCYCTRVQHVTDLTVDKIGIEGAAVTVIVMDAESAPSQNPVLADFVVDKAFGFIITDSQNVTLFSGVVNNI